MACCGNDANKPSFDAGSAPVLLEPGISLDNRYFPVVSSEEDLSAPMIPA